MGISDKIEAFIIELMKDENDFAEFGRNELADIFNCVPSQINYVISTRFSPEKGYAVESRRGGGGYIKIRKVNLGSSSDVIAGIGDSCDEDTAKSLINYLYKVGTLERQSAQILLSVLSDRSLSSCYAQRDKIRADILKNTIVNLER